MDQPTQAIADYAAGMRFEALARGAIDAAKRHLIDSVGCALGAVGARPVAIARRGIFSDRDSLGLAVSRPLHITSGSASILASSGVTDDRGIVYAQEIVSLASTTPETDYELGYTTLLSADTMLQASLIYQQNAGGEAGVDALAGVVTLTKRW